MSMPESPREGVLAAITSVCFSVKKGERSVFTGTEESGLGVRRGLEERRFVCCGGCLDISSSHPKTTPTAGRRMRGSVRPRGREGEGAVQDRRHPSGPNRDTGMEQLQEYQERKEKKK